jgi:hypothetical protein
MPPKKVSAAAAVKAPVKGRSGIKVGHFAETPVSKSASSISVDEVCLNSQM